MELINPLLIAGVIVIALFAIGMILRKLYRPDRRYNPRDRKIELPG